MTPCSAGARVSATGGAEPVNRGSSTGRSMRDRVHAIVETRRYTGSAVRYVTRSNGQPRRSFDASRGRVPFEAARRRAVAWPRARCEQEARA